VTILRRAEGSNAEPVPRGRGRQNIRREASSLRATRRRLLRGRLNGKRLAPPNSTYSVGQSGRSEDRAWAGKAARLRESKRG